MEHVRLIVILALRNLSRHLRRTALTAAAMVIGSGLMIFSFAFGDGSHEQWIDSGVRLDAGHITIERPEFRLSRKIEDRLPEAIYNTTEQALNEPEIVRQVKTVSAKLTISGLASSPAGARPVQVIGVDPISESEFSMIDEQIVKGRYLETDDLLGAYVGIGLIESLDLELGSRFVLTAQDANKEITGQLVRVVGIFRTGIQVIDQALVHIPIATADEWLGTEHGVTNIGVIVEPSTAVPLVSHHLRHALAEAIDSRSITVMSWQESMPELAAIVAIDEFGNYLIFGILFLIISLSIVNTVLMSVLHRRREFGILQALGLTPRQTGTLVLVEGLTLTSISGILGIALGVALTWFFFGEGLDLSMMVTEDMTFSGVVIDPVVIPLFRTTRILQSFTFILCIGIVSSIYPALRAARIDVPEAMKFDR